MREGSFLFALFLSQTFSRSLEQWSTDAAGLTTHIKQERLGNGITRQTQTNPDGTGVVTNMQNDTATSVQQMNSDGTAGNVTTYTYDEYNRNTGTVEKAGETVVNTVAMTYDAAGQILSQAVNGQTTTYAYDVVNRLRTTTLPGNRVIVEESWPTGELKRLSGADTYTQEWTWDPVWGTQATLTTWKEDAIPQVTTWVYNNRGFNTAKLYADNNGPTYTYDADGNMLTRTWARGIITTYTYDAAGRMTEQSYSDDTPSITASYNFLNQPLTITDAAGVRTLTYNSQSRLENETIPGIMNNMGNSYSYDAYGRRILRRLNTNGVAQAVSGIAYDVKGRVASIGNGADTLHYAYRPGLSQLDTATWRNSQDAVLNSRTYAYDAYHRLTGINLNNASEVAYTLNDKDQRTAASYAVGGAWSYSYDDKSQVTGAIGNNTTFSYAYDGIGNRLTAAEGSDTWSYTSNLLNQYTAINSNQPTYDADGNMLTTGDGWLYTWNGENRLIRAENSDTLVEMAYDYMGRRVEKKVSSKGLFTFYNWNVDKHYKFAYDDYKLIAVYDAANNNALLMTFTWQPESVGLDVPVSMAYDGNTYYYVTDGNKNVTGLLDQAGNRVAEYVYGPFGQLLSAEGELAEVNPFRFSSEYADGETGLVYYNYRYYNAKLGRWIKRDPIEEQGGMNLYSIVDNSSIDIWDYLGLYSMEERDDGTFVIDVEKCEIVLFDGHGSDEKFNTFRFGHACSAAGYTGCYAKQNNEKIPKNGRLPNYPKNTGEIESPSEEKERQRRILAAATLNKAQSFCIRQIKNGKKVGCCSKVNIFVVSNISSVWRGDRSASYTYDCDTGRVTLNSGVNPITNYLVVR